MIKTYLKERKSWIMFVIFSQMLMILIGYLDRSIPLNAILYTVFLVSLFFLVFVVVRYFKETRFYKAVKDQDQMPLNQSPFEHIISEAMNQQNDQHNRELSILSTDVEGEREDMLSWIHEVKTPLTTMQLMIDRVEDAALRSQLMYEWLRIHLLLDRQLHQKRIPFISNDLFIEETELEPVLFEEIKALKPWCMQKGTGFEVDLQITYALTDPKWFAFIIRQLLTNAVKYSEKTDVLIKSDTKDEQRILVIQDFGRGIGKQDLPRIFDRGFTNTTAHYDERATGMGLYLAKQAADALHIDIHVTSKLMEGTRFTLTFPNKNDFVDITGM
ncbi:Histidine kinase [Lentibacillus sp. JNUCC-1]|uniref:sensor histidine kinase n=1 Tax=Lentibacillus sp. JNUCC-1 TaxID=2654513 RepID=UPI0012E98CBB|nr:sensor histidine kinase [Lentibacillus sp. JNUCC-1]MUV36429.1 Histidine kinase [Lentibacillus sp. JNUCC-1]